MGMGEGVERHVAGTAALAFETLGELPQGQLPRELVHGREVGRRDLDSFRIEVMADQVQPLIAGDRLAYGRLTDAGRRRVSSAKHVLALFTSSRRVNPTGRVNRRGASDS
jgi:hypothetical protein